MVWNRYGRKKGDRVLIIYKVTNNINGKIYIGQTCRTLYERMGEHVRRKTTYFDRAFSKQAKDNFTVKVIDSARTQEELNEKEIFWITFFKCLCPNGYNMCDGGGVTSGYHHSQESKIKMSTAKKISGSQVGEKNSFYGKTHSDKQKAKWSEERKGSRHTKETIDKLRMSKKNAKSVINLNTGEKFISIAEAARFYGLKQEHISRVCRGQRKRTGGYVFEYIS